jgi:hypothetical protein
MFSQTLKVLNVISMTHHKCVAGNLTLVSVGAMFQGSHCLCIQTHARPPQNQQHIYNMSLKYCWGIKVFLEFQGYKYHS